MTKHINVKLILLSVSFLTFADETPTAFFEWLVLVVIGHDTLIIMNWLMSTRDKALHTESNQNLIHTCESDQNYLFLNRSGTCY